MRIDLDITDALRLAAQTLLDAEETIDALRLDLEVAQHELRRRDALAKFTTVAEKDLEEV